MFLRRGIPGLVILVLLLHASLAVAILPESVGSSQYGTGYISAADKYIIKVDALAKKAGWSDELKIKLYSELDKLLLSSHGQEKAILQASKLSASERKTFLTMICTLQDTDRLKKPRLFMIGKHRAVATDGHHRLRTMVKLTDSLKEANKLWPMDVREILISAGRIDKERKLIMSLPLIDPIIVTILPKDAKAYELMRALLKEHLGLWLDPSDNDLAAKFHGKKSEKASKSELKYLASKLGITDGPEGIKYIPITELPDNSMRTLMGKFFATRGFKEGKVSFKDYVEFYVGDDVTHLVNKHPEKYPSLAKVTNPKATIAEQRLHLNAAMDELDELFSLKKKLNKSTVELSSSGKAKKAVQSKLEALKFKYCEISGVTAELCLDFLTNLKEMNKSVTANGHESSPVRCPGGQLINLLKILR